MQYKSAIDRAVDAPITILRLVSLAYLRWLLLVVELLLQHTRVAAGPIDYWEGAEAGGRAGDGDVATAMS